LLARTLSSPSSVVVARGEAFGAVDAMLRSGEVSTAVGEVARLADAGVVPSRRLIANVVTAVAAMDGRRAGTADAAVAGSGASTVTANDTRATSKPVRGATKPVRGSAAAACALLRPLMERLDVIGVEIGTPTAHTLVSLHVRAEDFAGAGWVVRRLPQWGCDMDDAMLTYFLRTCAAHDAATDVAIRVCGAWRALVSACVGARVSGCRCRCRCPVPVPVAMTVAGCVSLSKSVRVLYERLCMCVLVSADSVPQAAAKGAKQPLCRIPALLHRGREATRRG
jgi:hypothetical protein